MIPGNTPQEFFGAAAAAAAGGAPANRSVRFNSADSAYLSRTPASAGNRKTWTWSGWVKRTKLSTTNQALFYSYASADNAGYTGILFSSGDELRVVGFTTTYRVTTQLFRDPSAWYHVVVAFDTTQATAANRIKVYVNGSEITTFSTSDNPTQNQDLGVNTAAPHALGYNIWSGGQLLDGYLALVHFIDGQALTPSSFGETSATTGQWIAKTYSGSYGTNGFFLDFADNSTAAALGYDAAGSNDWTVNNLSVTAGSGNDSLRDHPTSAGTSTGLGGEVSGNYATLNPLTLTGSAKTYANGNLEVTATSFNNIPSVVSTFGARSGKWYAEVIAGWSASGIGFINADSVKDSIESSYGLGTPVDGWTRYGTYIFNNGVLSSGLTSIATNDLLQLALDLDNGKAWFGINGTWENSGNPANGTNPSVTFTPGGKTFLIGSCFRRDGTAVTMVHNYGARAFAYTAPSGFSPLVDTLLPTPTIAKPNTVMDVKLYTGNASTQTISGLAFSPDLVWTKSRANSFSHLLYDTVRGATKYLTSNNADAEGTGATTLTAFNSDGFTLGSGENSNQSGGSVAWAFDAGSSNATNTSGTTQSTVRANISAGFSVVTYAPSSSAVGTVGHGLGVAPEFYIVKKRSLGTDWAVYHKSIGATKYLRLNGTLAATTDTMWNNTEPTSSVFSYGKSESGASSGDTYVAYCWTPVAGYSAFGSYAGTSVADGPHINVGFRPRLVLIKPYDWANNWMMFDSSREPYNQMSTVLWPNLSSAELNDSDYRIDFLSNGFKLRDAGGGAVNRSPYNYIYCAWAEAPFPYARAR